MKRGFSSMLTPTLQQAGQTQVCSMQLEHVRYFDDPAACWIDLMFSLLWSSSSVQDATL